MYDLTHLLLNDPGEEFLKSFISEFAKSIYKKITTPKEKKGSTQFNEEVGKNALPADVVEVENKIGFLIISMFKWSTESEFFGASIPINIKNTIALTISFNLREYTSESKDKKKITEQELFETKKNFLIYGDPGSGKTTTLKRLLSKYFFSGTRTSSFLYPYLIRLKNIPPESTLYEVIANDFGFKVSYESFESVVTRLVPKKDNFGNYIYKDGHVDYAEVKEIIVKKRYQIDGEAIERFIANFLEETRFFIAMDGLDELHDDISSEVQHQIEQLGSNLFHSKIVVTCRPGYLEKRLESFVLTEIAELEPQQTEEICRCWIDAPVEFLSLLKTKSYFELSNKPLFLSYLLVLFKDTHTLPDYAKEVYEEIIDFYLVRWDKDNGVKRQSKYSNFRTSVKRDFLSHLAFHLTYKIRSKVFTTADLKDSYSKIYSRFGLPAKEAGEVASELQTHTGIIVKAFFNKYEFCHLSIQEYLCASYIVRGPFTPLILEYLTVFPSPLALVVSHSSNPSDWFANLVLECLARTKNGYGREHTTRAMSIILSRIIVENPYFERSIDLGVSVLYISTICDITDEALLNAYKRFIYYSENIIESIVEALGDYSFKTRNKDAGTFLFNKKNHLGYSGQYDTSNIERLALPFFLYEDLKKNHRLSPDQV